MRRPRHSCRLQCIVVCTQTCFLVRRHQCLTPTAEELGSPWKQNHIIDISTMAAFVPRRVFPTLDSLPRSYFLGHHRAGLAKMNTMLSQIDLIIECRDYRVPLTSRNPMFEQSLAGRERLIVYTKKDLGSAGGSEAAEVGRLLLPYAWTMEYKTDVGVCREKALSVTGINLLLCSSPITKTVKTSAVCSNSQEKSPKPVVT